MAASSSIDVSTWDLSAKTSKLLGDKYPITSSLATWKSVGTVVKTQLSQRKGVRLGALGTFSITTSGDPTFVMAPELAQKFKLKFTPMGQPDNIPTTAINFTQLAQEASLPREDVEKIYTRFVSSIGASILEGRNVNVSVHSVAEIAIVKGAMTCDFTPEFTALFRSPGRPEKKSSVVMPDNNARAAALAKAQRAMRLMENAGKGDDHAPRGISSRDNAKAAAAKSRTGSAKLPPPPPRAVDNIFGDASFEQAKAPPPRPTNPIIHADEGFDHDPFANHKDFKGLKSPQRPGSSASIRSYQTNGTRPSADTLSLLHSPLSRPSTTASDRRVQARMPSAQPGLRKEILEKQQRLLERQQQQQLQQRAQQGGPSSNVNKARPSIGNHAGARGALGIGLDARAAAAKALDTGAIVQRLREKIVARGGSNGIRALQKLFAIMDDTGDKRLNKEEMRYGLRNYGVELSGTELDQAFMYFDRDNSGTIDFNEFLVGIRGELNERRKKIVRMAFNILDTDGSGFITSDEIFARYDMAWNPDVKSGKMTMKEAVVEFMAQWERGGDANGIITPDEFEDHYKEVSASIDGDDYFELMMRNAWRIAGGEGAAANTANRRVLVTNKDGTQRVETINQELGMNKKDMADIKARLARQGVDAANVDLYGGLDSTDKPKNAGGRPAAPDNARRGHTAVVSSAAPSPAMASPQSRLSAPRASASAPAPAAAAPARQSSSASASANARANAASSYAPASNAFNPFDAIRRLLYDPPISFDQLGARLQISIVSTSPRVPMGAFASRITALDASLDRAQIQAMWKCFDTAGVGSVELQKMYDTLAQRFGKDKKSAGGSGIVEKVIAKILERCGGQGGIKGLQRTLAVMDDNGDKRLSKEEMKYGLRDYGIELNIRELDEIFLYFDRDRNGFVDMSEFLVGIRGDLNPRRKALVQQAFDILDMDGSGFITIDEISAKYDVSQQPDVISGKKTKQEAIRDFMAQWERGEKDGVVSFEEFEDYYKEVSASIDGDDYFELMMRNAWRIAGGEGAAANTANRRVLVTNKDGTQRVETINQELGMNKKDMADIKARLARQGVDAANVDLYGGLDSTDKPKNAGGRPAGPSSRPASGAAQKASPRPAANAAPAKAAAKPSIPPGRDAFARNLAAIKLAAAFRGRIGRKKAAQVKRQADAQKRMKEEEEAEKNRPRPSQLIRPQPKRKS